MISSGILLSITIFLRTARFRLICCTGLPTQHACQLQCIHSIFVTCTRRVRQACPTAFLWRVCLLICATFPRLGIPFPAERITSCLGLVLTGAPNAWGGQNRFVLAGSGHIAGMVNPPQSGKYNHFVSCCLPDMPEGRLEIAIEFSGSWWSDWQRWVAIKPGDGALRSTCAAPGLYVKVRAV